MRKCSGIRIRTLQCATLPADILPGRAHEAPAKMSPNRSHAAPQYRITPSCCPSCCKAGSSHQRREIEGHPRRLTYAERVAQQHLAFQDELETRPKRAHTIIAAIRTRPPDSGGVDQNTHIPRKAATVRHKRAHQDLRRSAYEFSKPLPLLPGEAACQRLPGGSDSRDVAEAHSVISQGYESKRSRLDGLVQSVKGIAVRCKSRCDRYARDVRLSLAWEVEEMI